MSEMMASVHFLHTTRERVLALFSVIKACGVIRRSMASSIDDEDRICDGGLTSASTRFRSRLGVSCGGVDKRPEPFDKCDPRNALGSGSRH